MRKMKKKRKATFQKRKVMDLMNSLNQSRRERLELVKRK
jgi:hypothetical protein